MNFHNVRLSRPYKMEYFIYLMVSSKKNICKHAASKLFDEVDILSDHEKMPCFMDNILGYKNYLDTFLNTYI